MNQFEKLEPGDSRSPIFDAVPPGLFRHVHRRVRPADQHFKVGGGCGCPGYTQADAHFDLGIVKLHRTGGHTLAHALRHPLSPEDVRLWQEQRKFISTEASQDVDPAQVV